MSLDKFFSMFRMIVLPWLKYFNKALRSVKMSASIYQSAISNTTEDLNLQQNLSQTSNAACLTIMTAVRNNSTRFCVSLINKDTKFRKQNQIKTFAKTPYYFHILKKILAIRSSSLNVSLRK